MIDTALVKMWGQLIGAISWDDNTGIGSFEYEPEFIKNRLDPAPIIMPTENAEGNIFSFPSLRDNATFKGVPGLLADILPDKYGKAIINNWLIRNGRPSDSLNPVETLCFIGERGMGAIEIEPTIPKSSRRTTKIELDSLISIAADILAGRQDFKTDISKNEEKALVDVLKIGTSAGGARAKAVIAYNEKTKQVRSGQAKAPRGYEHWLIKFDGVMDSQFEESQGYGRIEMAYYHMATAAGVEMMPCNLLEENGRAHFMTKRFDRVGSSEKLHLQSFCAMRHFDFNDVHLYSYEQLFETMRMLRLTYPEANQMFRRMIFNVMSRNCDDHTKNFAFLMHQTGKWTLSPAYDICHAYRPGSKWVSRHALSINGKREDLTREDLMEVTKNMNIKKARYIIQQVQEAVSNWTSFAQEVDVNSKKIKAIESTLLYSDFNI